LLLLLFRMRIPTTGVAAGEYHQSGARGLPRRSRTAAKAGAQGPAAPKREARRRG
jgi:hypothetical protein